MKCPKCNNEIPEASIFCAECGTKINQDEMISSANDIPVMPTMQSGYVAPTIEMPPGPSAPNLNEANPSSAGSTNVPPSYTQNPQRGYSSQQPPVQLKTMCKVCGGQINPKSKVCGTCGKQYFKMSAIMISLIIVSALLIGTAVFSTVQISKLQKNNKNQASVIESLNAEVDANSDKLAFMDKYVVIELEGDTKYYHKYECPLFKNQTFWIFNITAAKNQGYVACPTCFK